jgi:hypothetical protein
MSISYARDDSRRLVTVTFDGPFSLRETVATLDRQAAEGTWPYARLYDQRRLDPPPSSHEIRVVLEAVRARIREHGPRGPVAILTDQAVVYGTVRQYMLLADDEPSVALFRDAEEAERWLAAHGHGKTPGQEA